MASVDELWLVDFGAAFPAEPARHRPALVLGPPDTFGPSFPFVIVCPLTTARRDLGLHVEIERGGTGGLDDTSYIQCELLRSINRRRLVLRLGVIDGAIKGQVDDIVRTLLGH